MLASYPFPAFRAHAAHVARQVVAALLAVTWWDASAVTPEKESGGYGEEKKGYPQGQPDVSPDEGGTSRYVTGHPFGGLRIALGVPFPG